MSTSTSNPTDTPTANGKERTSMVLLVRLSVMMFLQYFVQGCYLPVVSVYLEDALGFSKFQIGVFGSALALGPLFAPFLLGQLVDRHFPTQYVLAVSHLFAGGLMLVLYKQSMFWPVVTLGTAYSIMYVPSMMLTNSLAFHHLRDQTREFPWVRVWGTIGFIVPAWLIEPLFLEGLEGEELNTSRAVVLLASGIAGIVMAIYCLTLPSTPPDKDKKRKFAPGAVLALVRYRHFAVLIAVSFLIGIVHKFYFVLNSPFLRDVLNAVGAKGAFAARISSFGQISEIAVMSVLAIIISRVGFKWTMMIGAGAYAVRCSLFAWASQVGQLPKVATTSVDSFSGMFFAAPDLIGLVFLGQTLHGLCFACFLATAFIYVDKVAPRDIRGSMQNIYGTFVLGLGFFAGGFISGQTANWFTTDGAEDWVSIWSAGAILSVLCLVILGVMFPRASQIETAPEE